MQHGLKPIFLAKLAGHDDLVMLLVDEFEQIEPSKEEIQAMEGYNTVSNWVS